MRSLGFGVYTSYFDQPDADKFHAMISEALGEDYRAHTAPYREQFRKEQYRGVVLVEALLAGT